MYWLGDSKQRKLPNKENDDDGNGVLRRPRLMTVFLVISSRSGGRVEVDILLVVTFPQHASDEDLHDCAFWKNSHKSRLVFQYELSHLISFHSSTDLSCQCRLWLCSPMVPE